MEQELQPLEEEKKPKKLNSQVKSLLISVAVLVVLCIVAFILAKTLPAGQYKRDAEGKIIEPIIYEEITKDFPFWKFILSPFLLFGSDGGSTVALIIVFLFVITGVMNVLSNSNILNYAIDRIVYKFGKRRRLLVFSIAFFFMFLGSFVGSFEEIVPFVPLMIILATKLGFDKYVGLDISLIAVCCGFSCGVLNSFTVGIAQKLAGLQLFSGIWLRLVAFVLVYGLLALFLYLKMKKCNSTGFDMTKLVLSDSNKEMNNASLAFGISLGVGFILTIASTFIEAISSLSLVFIALGFLAGGISATIAGKIPYKKAFKDLGMGIVFALPCVFMIMLASAVKYILYESSRLDTILHFLTEGLKNVNKVVIVLVIFFIVLLFNLLIPSGSAKAFLLIPILAPLAKMMGISLQLVILAFAFGDGFSNMFYPTNPVLIISLNEAHTSYFTYLKNMWPLFLGIFALSIGLLLFGFGVGY